MHVSKVCDDCVMQSSAAWTLQYYTDSGMRDLLDVSGFAILLQCTILGEFHVPDIL